MTDINEHIANVVSIMQDADADPAERFRAAKIVVDGVLSGPALIKRRRDLTPAQILALPLGDTNIAYESTATDIRGLLIELVRNVWREGEGFSGKRPFGTSGWQWEVHEVLVREGVIDGEISEDGYLVSSDGEAANVIIQEAITALGVVQT